MKSYFYTLIFVFLTLFNSKVSAQWESLGNNILHQGYRVWSIKIAPDRSVWAIGTLDSPVLTALR